MRPRLFCFGEGVNLLKFVNYVYFYFFFVRLEGLAGMKNSYRSRYIMLYMNFGIK